MCDISLLQLRQCLYQQDDYAFSLLLHDTSVADDAPQSQWKLGQLKAHLHAQAADAHKMLEVPELVDLEDLGELEVPHDFARYVLTLQPP